MSRFFAPISEADLRQKIEAEFYDDDAFDPNLLLEKLGKDLKVSFDWENYETGLNGHVDYGPRNILGIHTLPNGLTCCGISAGGDWESPVFFIVYWDGKKLRGYVPTDGNPWNTSTKQAYGNDEDADLANARKRWPDSFNNVDGVDAGDFDTEEQAIIADITARIQPQGGAKPVAKPKPARSKGKPTLQSRIEGLTYYGTGAEDYELFQQACAFCYNLYGLGDTDKAEQVCQWAEEMAEASKQDAEDDADTAKGYWGH